MPGHTPNPYPAMRGIDKVILDLVAAGLRLLKHELDNIEKLRFLAVRVLSLYRRQFLFRPCADRANPIT